MTDNRLNELKFNDRDTTVSRNYSRFVRLMRFAFPITALALVVIVITWSEMDDKITAIPKEQLIPSSKTEIGENELINPNFETTDAHKQPVNVTAKRALQNQENPDLIKLEAPAAELKMKDGSDVEIEALDGTYEQKENKLFLQNQVKIRHESGYELQGEEMRVDMETQEAFSDKNVRVDGPEAKIEATGLKGNVSDGVLIFKGPAKLTLTPTEKPVP